MRNQYNIFVVYFGLFVVFPGPCAIFGPENMFLIISLAGNALNFALNLLGCYVHDMRLQFLEFFGRFYKDGGKAYRPLRVRAKHVEIIKEDTKSC